MRNIDEANLWHRTSPIFFTKKQILEILVAIEMRHCGMSKCLFDFVESFLSKSQLNSVKIKSDTLTKVKTKTSRWAFERRSSGRISWRDLSFYWVKDRWIDQGINRHISRFWIFGSGPFSRADCAKWHMHAAIIFFVGAFLLGLLYFQCLVYSRLKTHFIALLTLAGRLVKDSFNHKSPSIPGEDTSI